MSLTGEITIGNLITAISVLLSAAALAYGWHKDRQLRRTEYADRIRHAAGVITANLERWQSLVQQFFTEVQPLLLDVERAAAQQQETAPARFALLRGLYEQRAVAGQRIAAESLGTAYIDLYGYDPRIHGLYLSAVSQMQQIDEQPIREYIHEHILEPEGLTHTSFPIGAEFPSPHPPGYWRTPEGEIVDTSGWNTSWGGAAGQMISTLDDMRVWAHALATGTLLTPATQKQREQFLPAPDEGEGVVYGFGMTDNNGWRGHDGNVLGYVAYPFSLPSQQMTLWCCSIRASTS